MQRTLDGLCKTSNGADSMLPYWLFKHCSYALAPIVSLIFKLSFSTGRPPKALNHAIISPVPKVSPPKNVSALRTISVAPILSRLCERYVVKHYLFPALCKVDITDQFAFRPTGSTTAALVYIMHHIGRGGRFGRGGSLYRYRSQLFVMFVGMIPTADRAVF